MNSFPPSCTLDSSGSSLVVPLEIWIDQKKQTMLLSWIHFRAGSGAGELERWASMVNLLGKARGISRGNGKARNAKRASRCLKKQKMFFDDG